MDNIYSSLLSFMSKLSVINRVINFKNRKYLLLFYYYILSLTGTIHCDLNLLLTLSHKQT